MDIKVGPIRNSIRCAWVDSLFVPEETLVTKIAFLVFMVVSVAVAEPNDSIVGNSNGTSAAASSEPRLRIQFDVAYTKYTKEEASPPDDGGRELHFFLGFAQSSVLTVGPFFNHFGKELTSQTWLAPDATDYSFNFFGAAALARFLDPSKTFAFTALLGAGRLALSERQVDDGTPTKFSGATAGYMLGAGGEARLHKAVHLGLECRVILGKLSKLTQSGGGGWYSTHRGDISRVSFGGGLRFVI